MTPAFWESIRIMTPIWIVILFVMTAWLSYSIGHSRGWDKGFNDCKKIYDKYRT